MDSIKTADIDKVPGSLEGVTWRKSSQDYGVTLAVPKEYYRYAKPLMGKENLYFVVLYLQVQDMQQAQTLLNSQADDIPAIPAVDADESIPAVCTIEQIADLLMMTPRNAQLLANSGVVVKINRGKYHRDKSTQGYIRQIREMANYGGSPDLIRERTRIAKENADKKALENAIMRKQYVHVPTIQKIMSTLIIETKNKILSSSSKAAPMISAGVQSTSEIKEVIDNALYDALRDLSDLDIGRLLMAEGRTKQVRTETKTKSKRVGRKVRRTKSRK